MNVRAYAVTGTPRTGSQYLCRLLGELGLGQPGEYLKPWLRNKLCLEWDVAHADYLPWLWRRKSAMGTFGIKEFWIERQDLHRLGIRDFDDALPVLATDAAWVLLTRLDVEAQARSWLTAERTNVWEKVQAPKARLSSKEVKLRGEMIVEHNEAWRQWFTERRIRPLEVVFEDLIDNPVAVTGRVVDHVLKEAACRHSINPSSPSPSSATRPPACTYGGG